MHPPKIPAILCAFLLGLSIPHCAVAQPAQPLRTRSNSRPPGQRFQRFTHFLWQDWTTTPPPSTPLPRRGLPSPLDSPPFYSSDWSYSDSPTIGEPDTSSYALSTALHLENRRTKLYGWVEPSFNVSTSPDSNYPEADNFLPNHFVLDRFVLIAERIPNTVQHDHVDSGFRFTNLFGTDYRFNVGKGYFLNQLTQHNRQYGYDAPFDWIDLYLPVAQGMNLTLRPLRLCPRYRIADPALQLRFQPLPRKYHRTGHTNRSHGHRQTQRSVARPARPSRRQRRGPWAKGAKPSVTACADYTTRSVNDNFYLCANGINNGEYGYNNVQHYDLTWYHKWSPRIHTATESWFMYQRDVPSTLGPIAPETNTFGALCHPGLARCLAPEYATMVYLQGELSGHDILSLRNELLNDKRGQRTGVASRYTEHTLSWTHWLGSTVQIRPELRYERSWDRPAYNNTTRFAQFTAAADLVLHY